MNWNSNIVAASYASHLKKISVTLSPAKIIGQERLNLLNDNNSLLLLFCLILVTHLPELQQLALW